MHSEKFVKELINCSKNDLDASQILYDSKKYSQCVSLFQQSVEKLNKAFGIISKKIDEDVRALINRNYQRSEKLLKENGGLYHWF